MFPNIMLHFDIGRKKSIAAVEQAMDSGRMIFLVTQKNIKDEDPCNDRIYSVGVLACVKQILKQTGEVMKILVEGKCRAEAIEYFENDKFMSAKILRKEDIEHEKTPKNTALVRKAQELFAQYLSISPKIPSDLILSMNSDSSIGKTADYICSNIHLEFQEKQILLEKIDTVKRTEKLIEYLLRENEILDYENEIGLKLKDAVDKNQREYFLREQIKVISQELGEDCDPVSEAQSYRNKLAKLKLPHETRLKLKKECDNLSKMPTGSGEATVLRSYLDLCLSLPWNKSSKDAVDIAAAQQILDKDHFGLKDVKERIIEFLSVKKLAPDIKGQIICFVGPPGVGKTSVAKSLACAMGKKYVRISLGGTNDESEIRGHRKTYVGAMPGRIISALKQVGVNNPLVLLDEIDKLSKDYHGDPAAALLEVLDPEQNKEFYDRYVEVPFDLGGVLFVATANDESDIPPALHDRLEIIELYSYNHQEKFNIAKKHLIPKQLKRHGMNARKFIIEDSALRKLIDYYTREPGVRELERKISSLMRKAARIIVSGSVKSVKINNLALKELLGPEKYKKDKSDKKDLIGVAQGLAWTSAGGETLPIEISLMKGKGDIQITGSLGDVMRESAQVAVSYVRSNAKKLGIKEDFYKNTDIHIHAPEGAVPKDGPSAGITITTALVSALSNVAVKFDVAMTGEVTLRGKILPIGGLKEKAMAAYREGIKTVIIPYENESDLEKVDEVVKKSINFILAKDLNTVFEYALSNKKTSLVASEKAKSLCGCESVCLNSVVH